MLSHLLQTRNAFLLLRREYSTVGIPLPSGDFLKEALRHASPDMPYRGPEYYQSGEYTYKCSVAGEISWFQGYEEIFYLDEKIYECYFHGGVIR